MLYEYRIVELKELGADKNNVMDEGEVWAETKENAKLAALSESGLKFDETMEVLVRPF